jgi:two-component system NtrC family sensor kinase
MNIARNAVEAMEGRGTLTATVARGPGFVEVRFDDEGPGIDPEKVARIFEPF